MKDNVSYYNSDEYREKMAELEIAKAEIEAANEEEAEQKKKQVRAEVNRLKKIFTKERCGAENMHFVVALIERAAFLRIELEHIEARLHKDGVLDFFTQGLQQMWREHPLSKVHVQYTKNYKDVISKLESYGEQKGSGSSDKDSSLLGLLGRGQSARDKYKKDKS